jgi:ABC-2 type transport system ATP-binding protein
MKALSITDLTKTYHNRVHALKGISFSVKEGDFFALLGPNGAGKSTTIGIITSLVNKTSGSVSVYDYDIDQDFNSAKACVGVVPQEFNFNVFERVIDILLNQAGYYGISRKNALPRAEKYLKKLGLWEKRRSIARSLSGGMKRRLMIARALIHEPRMLILDEPTAGVDIEVRRLMWVFLRELNQQGTTIILTTHYLEEAENLCRNIAIIDHGVIVENTSMSRILKQLDSERFILYLQQPLSVAPEIPGYHFWLLDEVTLEVEVPKELGMNQLFSALQSQKIQVLSMRNKANRLEELFLKLTGDKK